jgi:hypothetical protein
MIKEIRINYLFLNDESWSKLMLACDELGWNKSSIIKHCLNEFFQRHQEFYVRFGKMDAQARGMTQEDYFRVLRDRSEDDLLPYVQRRPEFRDSPLDGIALVPQHESFKRKYNVIGLFSYNYVLLKVARIVAGTSMVQVVSRSIVKHLQDDWDTTYQPEIDRDRACRFD